MIDKNDLQTLMQILDSLEDASPELERAYEKGDKERFEKIKKEILYFQEKASEILKWVF